MTQPPTGVYLRRLVINRSAEDNSIVHGTALLDVRGERQVCKWIVDDGLEWQSLIVTDTEDNYLLGQRTVISHDDLLEIEDWLILEWGDVMGLRETSSPRFQFLKRSDDMDIVVYQPGNGTRYAVVTGVIDGNPYVALPDFGRAATMDRRAQYWGYIGSKLHLSEPDARAVAVALDALSIVIDEA